MDKGTILVFVVILAIAFIVYQLIKPANTSTTQFTITCPKLSDLSSDTLTDSGLTPLGIEPAMWNGKEVCAMKINYEACGTFTIYVEPTASSKFLGCKSSVDSSECNSACDNIVLTANVFSPSGTFDIPPGCGDESCNGNETCSSCPLDCGMCPT